MTAPQGPTKTDQPKPGDPDYTGPGKGVGRQDAPGQNKPQDPPPTETDPDAPRPDQTLPGDLEEDEDENPPA